MKNNKKGQAISQLQSLIVPLIGIGIVLVIGFLIMAETKTQLTAQGVADDSAAMNGTNDTINAMADIPGWLPIIVITVIGAILIGLVGMFRRS